MKAVQKTAHPGALMAPKLGEPYLLTPGPLTTAFAVKEQMLRDWGSWDADFREMTATLRAELLSMVGSTNSDYDCVPMQGSGTFSVEAMLGSFIPRDGKALLLVNGAYGQRTVKTMNYMGRDHVVLDKGDYLPPRAYEVAEMLEADSSISHVVVVHCETSSGILNPIKEIAEVTHAAGCKLLIDSMSAFGAIEVDMADLHCDALVSSANKCIEGVPGFGFVIAHKKALQSAKGNCPSLSLDVHDQWQHMEKTGQWRFTPPTHVVAAFIEALQIHRLEGGVSARGERYQHNRDVLVEGMRELGFETLLQDRWLSPIIVTFFNPSDPNFEFDQFYDLMKAKGFIIYPGKLTVVDSFRVGCIGNLDEHVMQQVIESVSSCLDEMGVSSAAPPAAALSEREKLSTLDREMNQ